MAASVWVLSLGVQRRDRGRTWRHRQGAAGRAPGAGAPIVPPPSPAHHGVRRPSAPPRGTRLPGIGGGGCVGVLRANLPAPAPSGAPPCPSGSVSTPPRPSLP